MAAQVEVQVGEVGRTSLRGRVHLSPLIDSSNKGLSESPSSTNESLIIVPEPTKPVPSPKPRLTPKPFVLERNPTIKPILAPKPNNKLYPEPTQPTGSKPDPPSTPKPLGSKPRPVSNNPTGPSPTSEQSGRKSTEQKTKPVVHPFKPALPLTHGDFSKPTHPKPAERQKQKAAAFSEDNQAAARSPKKFPAAEWSGTTKKEEENERIYTKCPAGTSMTRAKSMGFLNSLGENEKHEVTKPQSVALRPQLRGSRSTRPVSAIFFPSPSPNPDHQVPSPRWEGRRPLSADLTARFESIGLSLHRKNTLADSKENRLECTTPASQGAPKPILRHMEGIDKKKIVEKQPEEDVAGASSIKRRITLLLDSSSSSSPGTAASDQGSSPQTIAEPEAAPMGIKQRIRKLTEDIPPSSSPSTKPTVKPRSLPLDRTTRFISERTTDVSSSSISEPEHSFLADKDNQQRQVKELAVNPGDQNSKTEHTSCSAAAGLDMGVSPKECRLGGEAQTVRASLFENVIERRIVQMLEGDDHKELVKTPGGHIVPQQVHVEDEDEDEDEDGGTLFTATYREAELPTGLLRVPHSFDTVQAVEGSRAVSESIPLAFLEDKAATLRSRRSESSRASAAAGSALQHQVQVEPTICLSPVVQPRYLRVGALPKWNATDVETEREAVPEGTLVALEAEGEEGAPKRLKMLGTDDQPKPKATYFALTGQMQEAVPGNVGFATAGTLEDPLVWSGPLDSQGNTISTNKPLLEEAFRKKQSPADEPRELNQERPLDMQVTEEMMMEMERQRDQSWKDERRKMRPGEIEREMLRQVEIERHQHLEFARMKERERQLEKQAMLEKEEQRRILEREKQQRIERDKQWDLEKQREMERERQRNEDRQRELDKEKMQLELQRDRRQYEELERIKEMERRQIMEYERQKQAELRLKEKKRRDEAETLRQAAIQQEVERLRELERIRQIEMERQQEIDKQREMERLREMERQREIERSLEMERLREMQRLREMERLREMDKQREIERLREMERQREIERSLEMDKQREMERLREMQRLREMERLREMDKQREIERLREMERQREMDKQRQREVERHREMERQRERQNELEKEHQKQLDYERQELETQRLRQEKERHKKEMERHQLLELEKKRLREKMAKEEADKLRQVAKRQEERQRLMEKQRRESQEQPALDPSPLRPRVLDLDSVSRDDLLSKAPSIQGDPTVRWKRHSPRAEEPYKPAILDIDSFTSMTQSFPSREASFAPGVQNLERARGSQPLTPERDSVNNVPRESSIGHLSPEWVHSPQDPWEVMPVEMSVDYPSVPDLPRKMPSKTILEQLLIRQGERRTGPERRWSALLDDRPPSGPPPQMEPTHTVGSAQEQIWFPRILEPPAPRSEHPSQKGSSNSSQALNRMRSRSVSRRSAPPEGSAEVSLSRMRSRSAHREGDRPGWVKQPQHGDRTEEQKDTDALVQESDSQYGTWEGGLHTDDSLTPATSTSDGALSRSPGRASPSPTAGHHEPDASSRLTPTSPAESPLLPLPEVSTVLLDTSVLRSRAQLGKRRAPRSRPTRTTRQSDAPPEGEGAGEATVDWRFRDSTDEKTENKEEDSDQTREVEPRFTTAAVSQPQRIPLFPGMDPAALKSQLKKRVDSDNPVDVPMLTPSQSSRSPFLPRVTRVLPPTGGKENGLEDSPQWLRELKSKKRLSQYENDNSQ